MAVQDARTHTPPHFAPACLIHNAVLKPSNGMKGDVLVTARSGGMQTRPRPSSVSVNSWHTHNYHRPSMTADGMDRTSRTSRPSTPAASDFYHSCADQSSIVSRVVALRDGGWVGAAACAGLWGVAEGKAARQTCFQKLIWMCAFCLALCPPSFKMRCSFRAVIISGWQP